MNQSNIENDEPQLIDIEAIVRMKAGKKADRIPKFVFKFLKRFIHQDFINEYLKQNKKGVEFCQGVIDNLGVELTVEGLENIPVIEGKRYTFASNHPLGAVDGVTLGAVLGKHYDGKIKYLVNDLLMHLKGLAPLCIPINKYGGQSRNLPMMIDEAFNHPENHILIFPAGICSRKIKGKIVDLPWNKAFITKSVSSQRDIVPVHFEGKNSKRFYRIANLSKRLKLKLNLAMFLLPDEMYRSRGNKYKVIIGKPIPWQTFDKSRTPAEWAAYVREQSYALAETR